MASLIMDNVPCNPRIFYSSMAEAADDRKRIGSPFETFPDALKEIRLKVADEMTVYETHVWIWTLGWNLGWPEAEVYAKSFLDNEIAGDMLSALSLVMLEKELGIHNFNHRNVIKREIDFYFQHTNENQFKVPGMGLREEIHGSVFSTNELTATISSMSIGSASVVDSVFSISAGSSADGQLNSTVSRSRCLVLTLLPEQKLPFGEKEYLKSAFARFNYNVEITICEKPNSYILVFEDEEKALKARAQSDDLGYKLVKYRERRPKPDNPVLFKTLQPLHVRDGKSLRSSKVCTLKKGAIIEVNQQKGRRGRVISVQDRESIGWVSLDGWVSLHSKTGIKLLNRLDDAHTRCISKGSHY